MMARNGVFEEQNYRASVGQQARRQQLVHRCARYACWFKLNDGNYFPGHSLRRFFESDRAILHVFYAPLRRPDLAVFVCVVFFA